MKLVFLFPGQAVNVHQLYQNLLVTDEEFTRNSIAKINASKITHIYFEDPEFIRQYPQTASYCIGYLYYEWFKETFAYYPSYLAGHSLGQYTAVYSADFHSFQLGLDIICQREQVVQQTTANIPYKGMFAVIKDRIQPHKIENICRKLSNQSGSFSVSIINSDRNVVVSYTSSQPIAMKRLELYFQAKIVPLRVDYPFHCPAMQDTADAFLPFLKKAPMPIPVISNVTARPIENNGIINSLYNHFVKPTLWKPSLYYLVNNGVQILIDVSSNHIAQDNMDAYGSNIVSVFSLQRLENIESFKKFLAESKKRRELEWAKGIIREISALPNWPDSPDNEQNELISLIWEIKRYVDACTSKDLIAFDFSKTVIPVDRVNELLQVLDTDKRVYADIMQANESLQHTYGLCSCVEG